MQSFSDVWVYLWFERSEDISWNPGSSYYFNFCLFEFMLCLKFSGICSFFTKLLIGLFFK